MYHSAAGAYGTMNAKNIMNRDFRTEMLWSGGMILTSFFASVIAAYWISSDLNAAANGIVKARTEIRQRIGSLENLAEYRQAVSKTESYRERLKKMLPPGDNLLGFPRELIAKGRDRGVVVQFTFDGNAVQPDGGGAGSVPFRLQAEGEYFSLREFVADFESGKAGFLTAVESLDIRERGGAFSAAATGRIFFGK